MSTIVELEDIFTAAEAAYGSLVVPLPGIDGAEDDKVELRPILRLSKSDRKLLGKAGDSVAVLDENGNPVLDEEGNPTVEDSDAVDTFQAWVRVVASNKHAAEKLIARLGERLDAYKVLQDKWSEKSQPGEASPSAS